MASNPPIQRKCKCSELPPCQIGSEFILIPNELWSRVGECRFLVNSFNVFKFRTKYWQNCVPLNRIQISIFDEAFAFVFSSLISWFWCRCAHVYTKSRIHGTIYPSIPGNEFFSLFILIRNHFSHDTSLPERHLSLYTSQGSKYPLKVFRIQLEYRSTR